MLLVVDCGLWCCFKRPFDDVGAVHVCDRPEEHTTVMNRPPNSNLLESYVMSKVCPNNFTAVYRNKGCVLFSRMNFAIALVPIYLLLRKGIASPCAASYSVQGQVLQNHTIKTENAERIEDCMMRCIEYPGCHSSNFYRIDKCCELNDKTHASHPEHMGYKPYTIHTENIFRPMPCRNKLDCGRQMICSSSLICEECRTQPLGMENNKIPNGAVTASSSWGLEHEPWQARLNNIARSGSTGSWSTRLNAIEQYLQIDLGKERVVNKIATQGRPSSDQWVTSFKLLFRSDGAKWNEYQNDGVVKVFTANSDRGTIVSHKLWPQIFSRYVRFSVMSWQNWISMRVELYGCAN
ncbi:uncharacterized protein [Acropora muricata]|uniref:uncharacterized protein isoform X2 n=1 Tax=Acropora muricata TaxID=159855 RepID=UPI0034E45781